MEQNPLFYSLHPLKNTKLVEQFTKGVYVDNEENRKLGRVGLLYGEDLTKKLLKFTTVRKYTDPFTKRYLNTRFALHRDIVTKIVDSGSVSAKPKVILLVGGSGSGKSHIYNTKIKPELEAGGDRFAYLNCDDIKEELPEYKEYIAKDPASAAQRVHEESADIQRVAFRKLMHEKRNFVYDATFANSYSAVSKIDDLKKAGYDVHVVGVVADLNVVEKAAIARGKATGRHVPLHIIKDRQIGARDTLRYFANKIPHRFANFTVYDNSGMLQGQQPDKIYSNGLMQPNDKLTKPE